MNNNTNDLINRQKAEIERLKGRVEATEISKQKLLSCFKTAKSEAIKEFAERLKKKYDKPLFYLGSYGQFMGEVDNLVKEMAGDTE